MANYTLPAPPPYPPSHERPPVRKPFGEPNILHPLFGEELKGVPALRPAHRPRKAKPVEPSVAEEEEQQLRELKAKLAEQEIRSARRLAKMKEVEGCEAKDYMKAVLELSDMMKWETGAKLHVRSHSTGPSVETIETKQLLAQIQNVQSRQTKAAPRPLPAPPAPPAPPEEAPPPPPASHPPAPPAPRRLSSAAFRRIQKEAEEEEAQINELKAVLRNSNRIGALWEDPSKYVDTLRKKVAQERSATFGRCTPVEGRGISEENQRFLQQADRPTSVEMRRLAERERQKQLWRRKEDHRRKLEAWKEGFESAGGVRSALQLCYRHALEEWNDIDVDWGPLKYLAHLSTDQYMHVEALQQATERCIAKRGRRAEVAGEGGYRFLHALGEACRRDQPTYFPPSYPIEMEAARDGCRERLNRCWRWLRMLRPLPLIKMLQDVGSRTVLTSVDDSLPTHLPHLFLAAEKAALDDPSGEMHYSHLKHLEEVLFTHDKHRPLPRRYELPTKPSYPALAVVLAACERRAAGLAALNRAVQTANPSFPLYTIGCTAEKVTPSPGLVGIAALINAARAEVEKTWPSKRTFSGLTCLEAVVFTTRTGYVGDPLRWGSTTCLLSAVEQENSTPGGVPFNTFGALPILYRVLGDEPTARHHLPKCVSLVPRGWGLQTLARSGRSLGRSHKAIELLFAALHNLPFTPPPPPPEPPIRGIVALLSAAGGAFRSLRVLDAAFTGISMPDDEGEVAKGEVAGVEAKGGEGAATAVDGEQEEGHDAVVEAGLRGEAEGAGGGTEGMPLGELLDEPAVSWQTLPSLQKLFDCACALPQGLATLRRTLASPEPCCPFLQLLREPGVARPGVEALLAAQHSDDALRSLFDIVSGETYAGLKMLQRAACGIRFPSLGVVFLATPPDDPSGLEALSEAA